MPARNDLARAVIRDVRSDIAAFGRITDRTAVAIDTFIAADQAATLGLLQAPAQENDMPDPRDRDSQWHLDKRVPIALILAMAMQLAGVLIYGTTVINDIRDQQRRIEKLERSDEGQTELLRTIRETLVRLDEQMKFLVRQLAPNSRP